MNTCTVGSDDSCELSGCGADHTTLSVIHGTGFSLDGREGTLAGTGLSQPSLVYPRTPALPSRVR